MTRYFATYVGPLLLLLAGLTSVAEASRRHQPMGYYVRQAELILIVDTTRGEQRGFHTELSVREVIYGDPEWANETIVLETLRMSTADARVPTPSKGVAVLLPKEWESLERWPVLEAYQKPHEIEALRILVKVLQTPDERQRLLELRKLYATGNPVLQEQLIEDFRNMQDPKNLDLITEWCSSTRPVTQRKLVDLLAHMGDPRGVPTLIEAMLSSDQQLSQAAAHNLYWYFTGAPGVTKAFGQVLEREHLTQMAARYLVVRHPTPALDALTGREDTRWQRAERLHRSGEQEAARAEYMGIILDENENAYTRRSSAQRVVAQASAEEKARIRQALLPQLVADAAGDNYIFALDAVKILRALGHVDCLDALIGAFSHSSFTYQEAAQEATMAIRELGPEARRKAVSRMLAVIESAADRRPSTGSDVRSLLELIWLGSDPDFQQAERCMTASYRATWGTLQPLLLVGKQGDEATFLKTLLERHLRTRIALPRDAWAWVLFRLGDLRHEPSIDAITECMTREVDWTLTRAAAEALTKIGGRAVEQKMMTLLTHEDHNRVRRHAIDVLFELQGERSVNVARRMLSEEDFGLKGPAMSTLGRYGTPKDLPLLLPFCDYWKADRSTQYWAMSAVASLRERYCYDVNGPIQTKQARLIR
jgi:HEAT repeat protein